MEKQDPQLLEKIRQQFDSAPYPRIPLEKSPKEDYDLLYIHNLVTPYYLRNQKVINTENTVILDAGCGSGYKSLVLAEANPGAKIIGIDISEASVEMSRKRLKFHGHENAEFYTIPLENVSKLGFEFDYINIDEVLYLLPNIVTALKALKSILKPQGIIRANLHSSLQRDEIYKAQKVFKMMGLMDENPREMEIGLAREVMNALRDDVLIKIRTWDKKMADREEWMLMNYLLQGDKGFTIPEIFAVLKEVNLEFTSMVKWRHWELSDLWQDRNNLPPFLAMSLPEITIEEQLHLFELFHPVHRLIDFWCGHPQDIQPMIPATEWTDSDWAKGQVHLHPQLRNTQIKQDLVECIENHQPFVISNYISLPTRIPIVIESHLAACLLPLWTGIQPFIALVKRWQKTHPFDLVTLNPVNDQTAFYQVKELLTRLEAFLYVLLERSA